MKKKYCSLELYPSINSTSIFCGVYFCLLLSAEIRKIDMVRMKSSAACGAAGLLQSLILMGQWQGTIYRPASKFP